MVIGIVDDVRKTLTEIVVGDTYVPYEQSPGGYLALLVRTRADPGLLAQPLQQRLAEIAPELPLHEVEPLAEVVRRQSRQQRFIAALLVAFSAITAAAALIGLYAVLAFSVALRGERLRFASRSAPANGRLPARSSAKPLC